MVDLINGKAREALDKNWLLNLLIMILIAFIAYQAHNYDKRFDKLEERVSMRATVSDYNEVCDRLDKKASRAAVRQLSANLQGQLDRLYEEIKGIRSDLKYYMGYSRDTEESTWQGQLQSLDEVNDEL